MQSAKTDILLSFLEYLPEIEVFGTMVLLVVLDIVGAKKTLVYIAITGLVINVFYVGDLFRVTMASAAIFTIAISKRERMEYYLLILSILLGGELLVVTNNFIIILLSMEMISLSSYVLVAGNVPEKHRAEAAWKFFIYGSVATATMIFGMSYLFGSSGSIELSSARPVETAFMFSLGSFMMLAGFLFKMTAAPFHLWAPDVYEATPSPIVAFLSVVPKLAAIAVIVKIGSTDIIAVMAIFSIVVGTLAALSQTDAKRMMAYSSVAQAGIMLAAISTGAPQPLVFYVIVFAIMNYTVFIVINTKSETAFADFSGLGYSNPFAAIAITAGLVSLVGLPPVAGFMAKLSVFTSIWVKYQETNSSIFLALFVTGLLATVASLFFYLKIPFYAFFRRTEEKRPIKISFLSNLLLIILVALLLALFVAPGLVEVA